jgi:hypothetical protein
MKQAHRKAIIAALAGAGFLAGNMAFGATNYSDYMELQAREKRQRTHISQEKGNTNRPNKTPQRGNGKHKGKYGKFFRS